MSVEKETLIVPMALLRQIKGVLNQVANPSSGLSVETRAAVNETRRQLLALFPMKLEPVSRSTDGPSADEIFQKGFRFGAKAVAENFTECADIGISSTEAFRISVEWLQRRRAAAFSEFVDGADPEYWELAKAFDRGAELGINQFLGLAREDHEDQGLPQN
jgi:hypothetical protein